jgi:hypothetical protein
MGTCVEVGGHVLGEWGFTGMGSGVVVGWDPGRGEQGEGEEGVREKRG